MKSSDRGYWAQCESIDCGSCMHRGYCIKKKSCDRCYIVLKVRVVIVAIVHNVRVLTVVILYALWLLH